MPGLFDGFREGYQEERERLGPPRPFFEWTPRPPGANPPDRDGKGGGYDAPEAAAPLDDAGGWAARAAELEAALQERSAEMAELANYAEQMKERIAKLEQAPAIGETFEAVLRLPGVEKWLRDRFHPDKHPKADDAERRALNDATQKINAAYSDLKRSKPPAA